MEDDFYDDILYGDGGPRAPRVLDDTPTVKKPEKRELSWDSSTCFDHLDDHYTPHLPIKSNADSSHSERTWRRWFRLFRGQE